MSSLADSLELSDKEWALTSFDPWDRRLNRSNIWTMYRTMREQGAVIPSDAHPHLYSLTRYADIKSATLDYKTFSSARGTKIGRSHTTNPPGVPLEYDPPDNNKFRSWMIAPFVPRRVGQFEPLVRAHVDKILGGLPATKPVDVVTDIAEPLAVSVISDIIGFDQEARRSNREHSLRVINGTNQEYAASREAYLEFLRDQLREAKQNPQPGLLGDLAKDLVEGGPFTDTDAASIIQATGQAGHHTTINGIVSMMIYAGDPELRTRWLSNGTGAVLAAFVEEVLRIDPPIHLEGRWTTASIVVSGFEIPADSQVALLYASANHDEAQYPDPQRFDPTRAGGHLSFGHGVHTCLGMALARLEMTVLLEQVMRRFPAYELASSPVDSGMVYGHHMGWHSLPIFVRERKLLLDLISQPE